MSRKLGHPAPAALASLRAGLPGGRHGRRLSAHVARCPDCAATCEQLDAVSATLREVPHASLPAAVERRVLMAMATEAARRRTDRSVRRGRAPVRFPQSLVAATGIAGALAMCAGFGYLLSSIRTTPVGPVPAAGSAVPGASGAAGPEDSPVPTSGVTITPASGESRTTAFLVTDSNITYQKATLRAQVRQAIAVQASAPDGQQPQPSAAVPTALSVSPPGSAGPSPEFESPGGGGSIAVAGVPPSQALVGCVFHLTGDVPPMFVDLATYQSEQVYVIAVANEAWVVGIGCTAARPTLIASVQLTSVR
jgi:hypothetical protein